MCEQVNMQLSLDVSAVQALLAQVLQAPLEVRHSVVDLLEAGREALWSVRVDLDFGSASGAAKQRIVLEPTQALLDLASALRAGDVDLCLVQKTGHGCPSRKVV